MGINYSKSDKIQPRELRNVRKFCERSNSDTSNDFKTKNRTTTDVCFLLFLTIFLTIFLIFLAYCTFNGDIFRIINGYDNCGNVCGRENLKRQNNRNYDECWNIAAIPPPLHITLWNNSSFIDRKCITNCSDYPGYRQLFNRCLPERQLQITNTILSKIGIQNFFQEVAEDFHLCWREFGYLCLISLTFSVLILFLFRYVVGIIIWLVLIGTALACSISTVILWIMWNQSRASSYYLPENQILDIDTRTTLTYFSLAIIASIVTICVILIIIVMRKRIELVVQLFKEAGKVIRTVPMLLFQPIITFICLVLIIGLWFYFGLLIESSGHLVEKHPHVYQYEKDNLMKFTRWYNLLGMLWMCQFVIGCQHMVIAGTVASWYFTRNKKDLNSPLYKSIYNLVRYHLGSVALGSFLIATVQFFRILMKLIEKYLNKHKGICIDCTLKCCQCCLYCFEKLLKYLNRNAYIEIGMHGYSFYHAAQQAFRILVANALRVTAINSVGDFVLFLAKVLVVVVTVLIGVKMFENKDGLQHVWVPITLAGLFGYFVAHCFITVYEMVIDTIFLCFCEDCEMNDGVNREYYMSIELMQFVENSKRALEISKKKRKSCKIRQEQTLPNISETITKQI